MLEFSLESAVFARSTVMLRIELFDFESQAWEVMTNLPAARFSDQQSTVSVDQGATRFVEPATGRVRARIRYTSLSPRQRFSANIDRLAWELRF